MQETVSSVARLFSLWYSNLCIHVYKKHEKYNAVVSLVQTGYVFLIKGLSYK